LQDLSKNRIDSRRRSQQSQVGPLPFQLSLHKRMFRNPGLERRTALNGTAYLKVHVHRVSCEGRDIATVHDAAVETARERLGYRAGGIERCGFQVGFELPRRGALVEAHQA
jgi:hypothetical protein